MKLLILGKARHGKDTLAEILRDFHGIDFKSSSMFCAEKVVYPVLKEKYGYETVEECYKDRVNHREEWARLIEGYNLPDRARLAREILEESQCYVGMRSQEEFDEARKLFDYIIWVDASLRVGGEDPTMRIAWEPNFITVYNNYGVPELKGAADALMNRLVMDYEDFLF